LSVGTGVLLSTTALVRSVRKGVDAMVKLAFSLLMTSTAFLGSQMSCSTALALSMMGIIRPYMKPVWCAMGEAISTTSSASSCRRCA